MNVEFVLRNPPTPLVHVLPGLLEGTVGLVTAAGGTGKTILLLQVAIAVATGRPICGGLFDRVGAVHQRKLTPKQVTFVVAEESHAVMTHRLHAAVAALVAGEKPNKVDAATLVRLMRDNLRVIPLASRGRPLLIDSNGVPTSRLAELHEASIDSELIILDPLRQLHSAEENDSGAMTDVLCGLQSLVAGRPAALVLAHHTSRAASTNGFATHAASSRGSSAITDNARWQLSLSKPEPEWLRTSGHDGSPSELIRVDLPKTNYLPPQSTALLRRIAGGAFTLASGCQDSKSTRL